MKQAIRYRKEIPFFYDKSILEIKQDVYEIYDVSIKAQSMIHLADNLHDGYPFQKILDYFITFCPSRDPKSILELGCGVGRMIGDIASFHPSSQCWGIDYSYQMLKKAKETFVDAKSCSMDFSNAGFTSDYPLQTSSLKNLSFGLAKAESLPFEDQSQDYIYSSFTLDRLQNPIQSILEMKRVLKNDGRISIITPLNFIDKKDWDILYPSLKLQTQLEKLGLNILDFKDDFLVEEPIDKRGNMKVWKCVAFVCAINQ